MKTETTEKRQASKAEFMKKFGLKTGLGKPNSFHEKGVIAGCILSVGSQLIKGQPTNFFSIREEGTNEVLSYWMDKGLETALAQNGIIGATDQGLVVKHLGLVGIEHLGKVGIAGTTKTVNNYQVYIAQN